MFKWLFGFIAGALILLFFIRFSYMHIAGEKGIEGFNAVLYVDDKLDAIGISEGSGKIDMGDDFDLSFDCNYIANTDETTGFFAEWKSDKIIFAPSSLKGETVNVWTKKWRFPYGVANFYYLANPKTMTLFIGTRNNMEEVRDLAEDAPGSFKVQTVEQNSFNLGEYISLFGNLNKLTMVFFGKSSYTVEEVWQSYGRNVEVEIIEVNLEEQTAKIYTLGGGVRETFYL